MDDDINVAEGLSGGVENGGDIGGLANVPLHSDGGAAGALLLDEGDDLRGCCGVALVAHNHRGAMGGEGQADISAYAP